MAVADTLWFKRGMERIMPRQLMLYIILLEEMVELYEKLQSDNYSAQFKALFKRRQYDLEEIRQQAEYLKKIDVSADNRDAYLDKVGEVLEAYKQLSLTAINMMEEQRDQLRIKGGNRLVIEGIKDRLKVLEKELVDNGRAIEQWEELKYRNISASVELPDGYVEDGPLVEKLKVLLGGVEEGKTVGQLLNDICALEPQYTGVAKKNLRGAIQGTIYHYTAVFAKIEGEKVARYKLI